jgi:hypothetical protein
VHKDKRPDDYQLHEWFERRFKDCGLAVINGSSSGWLACRDFDSIQAYDDWATAHPELAETLPTVRTARGRHVYFRHSGLEKTQIGITGELRVTGINVLPPSLTAKGAEYSWITLPTTNNLQMIDDLEGSGLWVRAKEKKRKGDRGESKKKNEKQKLVGKLDEDEAIPSQYLPRPSAKPIPHHQVPIDDEIQKIIDRTQPEAEGQRNFQVFELARELKALPRLAGESALCLREIVDRWHRQALSRIETKDFSVTWLDFINGWVKVKWPKGVDPIEIAMQRYKANPQVFDLGGLENDKMQDLAGLCCELQRMNEPGPFFLSSPRAGKEIGVDQATAWRYLQYLKAVGLIAEAQKGDRRARRATRFWFLVQDQEEQEGGADDE